MKNILETLKKDTVQARKNREPEKDILTVYLNDVQTVGKNNGNRETTDKEAIVVLKKQEKKCKETINSVEPNSTLYQQAKNELEILKKYLPKQLSVQELEEIVSYYIEKGKNNIGEIMGALSKEYKGQYDGREASNIVKQHLS